MKSDLKTRHGGRILVDALVAQDPKLADRVREADVLLVIGARLGEMTTGGYSLVEAPVPRQSVVHVHAGAEELGRVYRVALPINSGYPQFVEALERLAVDAKAWKAQTEAARAEYLEWTKPQPMPGKLQYGE